jgi:hypothetical protein
MSTEEQKSPLDELQHLLQRQIEAAQKGNLAGVELLSKRAEPLVGQIAASGILGRSEFEDRREQLKKLYNNLCLAITAQKKGVSERLSRIRKGRKTIGVYRTNT